MRNRIPKRSRELAVALWIGSLTALLQEALARPVIPDLGIQADYKVMSEPLTTEKGWTLDPDQTNPHLRRWLVSRHAELAGLKAIPKKEGKWGVAATAILAVGEGYFRAAGSGFQPYSDFRCSKTPDPWFQTQEGAKIAAQEAAQTWFELLTHEKMKLALLLERIGQPTAAAALDQGERTFRKWLTEVSAQWRSEVDRRVREVEWEFYLTYAKKHGICDKKDLPPVKPIPVTSVMEPLKGSVPAVAQLLARAPARIWDGYFSIRLNLTILNKTLNGRFLIDSTSPVSILSPGWLESQGIYPVLIEVADAPPRKVQWEGDSSQIEGLAKQGRIEGGSVGDWAFPLKDFLIFQTDLFSPPESVASCCDGILGTDFLRHAAFEFQSSSPPEVKIWPREGFRAPLESWIELHQTPEGRLASFSTELPQPMKIGKPYFSPKNFSMDLSQGRLWYSSESVTHPTRVENRSGLKVEFKLKSGERFLQVAEIKKGTPAESLMKLGLKKGMKISKIDQTPVEELDLWEVNQKLAGGTLKPVVLEWMTRSGIKAAPLLVP